MNRVPEYFRYDMTMNRAGALPSVKPALPGHLRSVFRQRTIVSLIPPARASRYEMLESGLSC